MREPDHARHRTDIDEAARPLLPHDRQYSAHHVYHPVKVRRELAFVLRRGGIPIVPHSSLILHDLRKWPCRRPLAAGRLVTGKPRGRRRTDVETAELAILAAAVERHMTADGAYDTAVPGLLLFRASA